MDWPLFIRVTSPKDGGEIDRKVPVGLVRGREVCWVADGCDTRRRPQHRSGSPACPAVGAVSELSVPSVLLLEEDCLQMWTAILTERFMFSRLYPILLLLQLWAHSLNANNWQKTTPTQGRELPASERKLSVLNRLQLWPTRGKSLNPSILVVISSVSFCFHKMSHISEKNQKKLLALLLQ